MSNQPAQSVDDSRRSGVRRTAIILFAIVIGLFVLAIIDHL